MCIRDRLQTGSDRLVDAFQLVGEVLAEAGGQRPALTVSVDWSMAAMQHVAYRLPGSAELPETSMKRSLMASDLD